MPVYGDLPGPPKADEVVVVYNSEIKASEQLANSYSESRDIPKSNLIGLPLVEKEEISRDYYNTKIRDPLVDEFDKRGWWVRPVNAEGKRVVGSTSKYVVVCIRGVPSRIKESEDDQKKNADKPKQEQMLRSSNASVDSELCLLGHEGYPLEAGLNNPYYKKKQPIAGARLPILLVGRIDGPSDGLCQAMIRDARETELTGLWGCAYIDVANKAPEGDVWMRSLAASFVDAGIPTHVDDFDQTLPSRFPLRDAALYFGWYDWNVSGPFKENSFKFKKGAIAVHLHSFSASQLRDPRKNWCAPLLSRGATATLGNTYEPFLAMTHNLDIFGQRLLDGYTLIEAAYMSMPVLSWQGVVIGDPLYRPFLHLDGSGKRAEADKVYRALRVSKLRWGADPNERERHLRAAAARMEEPMFLEAVALDLAAANQDARASAALLDAKHRYTSEYDKLRMDLYNIGIQRRAGRKVVAVQELRDAEKEFGNLPEVIAVKEWLKIVDPPPADSQKK